MKLRTLWPMATLVAAASLGGWASGGIEGSKHDFSDRPWAGDDTCGVCHTPHRRVAPKAAPLWNPKADLSRRFGTAIGRNAAATGAPRAGTGTTMCLRCHDGTVADAIIAGKQSERPANQQRWGMFRAVHGASDHPVGVAYPQMDRGYRPMPTVVALGSVLLPQGRVECVSCHDPHNSADTSYMLVTSNAGSALCLTCHNK